MRDEWGPKVTEKGDSNVNRDEGSVQTGKIL